MIQEKKNILTEATINKLENEKKRLTLQMEDLSESNKNIIDKLNKQIKEKNYQIELTAQNHQKNII